MSNERLERGREKLRSMHGEPGLRTMEMLEQSAPDLARFIYEFAFGDVYCRPGLDLKTRQMATVVSLATLGNAQPQLKVHLHAALRIGITREELMELLLQVVVYAGFPAGLNAVVALREVLADWDAKGCRPVSDPENAAPETPPQG